MGQSSAQSKIPRNAKNDFPFNRDNDQDNHNNKHCALAMRGGGWFKSCAHCHLTGVHTKSSTDQGVGMLITWVYGGDERGGSWASWKEAKMTLIHK